MISSLIATCLLSFACSIGSLKQDVVSKVPQQVVETPKKAISPYSVYGSYNFKDIITFSDLDIENGIYSFTFEDISDIKQYINPYYCSDYAPHYYYISKIDFTISGASRYLTFYHYDVFSGPTSVGFNLSNVGGVDDFPLVYRDLFITFRNSYTFDSTYSTIFNSVFTPQDNAYMTTYTGYYNFVSNNDTINHWFFVSGSILFNNMLYTGMTNCGDGQLGSSPYSVVFPFWDIEQQMFQNRSYALPLSTNEYVDASNMILTSCKMSLDTYETLSQVGVFGFVRDTTYDNATFYDLLLGIMDSPIYMISRLLSWELFGFNLYLALCGLLTIIAIIAVIRYVKRF